MADEKGSPDQSHLESNRFEQAWKEEQWESRKLSQAAQDRARLEHELTPGQCIKAYPMAIFWCLMVRYEVDTRR